MPPEEEIKEIMENYDIDEEEAEIVLDLVDEYGLSEDEAVEIKDDL